MELNARATDDRHTCCWHLLSCTGWRRRKLPLHLLSATNLPDTKLLSLLGSALKLKLFLVQITWAAPQVPYARHHSWAVRLCAALWSHLKSKPGCRAHAHHALDVVYSCFLCKEIWEHVLEEGCGIFDKISHLEDGEGGTPEYTAVSCWYRWCFWQVLLISSV